MLTKILFLGTISTTNKPFSTPVVSTSVLTQQPNVINSPDISNSVLPKRGRGRPRKNPVTTSHTSQDVVLQSSQPSVRKQSNFKESIPNDKFVTKTVVDQPNVKSSYTQLPPSKGNTFIQLYMFFLHSNLKI